MTTADVDDELTELYDATMPRVDLVGKGASGVPRWLIAKQEDGAGLMDPGFVRDLISKAEPGDDGWQVTMTGTPAAIGAIAAAIHKAALSTKSVNDLDDSDFAYIEPGGKKDDSGKTTPRSLRHFPVNDEPHVRNALSRAPQSPFGDKAMPKIKARAKELGIDVSKEAAVADQVSKDAAMGPDLDDGVDGMDPMVPLAAPDEDAPGDPTDPGSPAWEQIDAATARKWTSIAVRLKNALCVLSDREYLEAASADPDDIDNAFDLEDAMCAVDFVIDTLARFAVGEQAEADLGGEAMEMIGKALAGFDAGPLEVVEGLAVVRKAGRVLSAANEAAIRTATASLQGVLASLPQAPTAPDGSGQPVAKEKETAMADKDAGVAKAATAEEQAAAAGPVQAGGTTGLGQPRTTGPAGSLPADGPQQAKPGDVQGRQVIKAGLRVAVYDHAGALAGLADPAAIVQRVAKADGDGDKPPMQAVFDQDGDLIGVVDPAAIMPVAGAGAKPAADTGPAAADPAAAPADPADMTPAPPADAGTPADGVAKSGGATAITQDVLKSAITDAVSAALAAQGATHQEAIAKAAADSAELAEELAVVKTRLETVEQHPAESKVFTNGQRPPADQLRGQDRPGGAPPVIDVAKARERKAELAAADGPQQAVIAKAMQEDALAAYSAMTGR